jgi:hypothetical protein
MAQKISCVFRTIAPSAALGKNQKHSSALSVSV